MLGQGLAGQPPPPCKVTGLASLPFGALKVSQGLHIYPLSLWFLFLFRHLAIAHPRNESEEITSIEMREV